MKTFTIKVRDNEQAKDEITIYQFIELAFREGGQGPFPVIPLGTVSKRPDETNVDNLPARFFRVSTRSKNRDAEPPSHINDIRVSAINEKGHRFGLWEETYITTGDDAPAFIYLADVDPNSHARFDNANDLRYEGLLIEGYHYSNETYIDKKHAVRWNFSCPSILFAEKDKKYQINWWDPKAQANREAVFHFDGQQILVTEIRTKEPNGSKKSATPVYRSGGSELEFLDDLSDIRKDQDRYRKELEKRRNEKVKAKKRAEKITRVEDEWDGSKLNLEGVNIPQAQEAEDEDIPADAIPDGVECPDVRADEPTPPQTTDEEPVDVDEVPEPQNLKEAIAYFKHNQSTSAEQPSTPEEVTTDGETPDQQQEAQQ